LALTSPNNVDAKHWKRLRDAFLRCIAHDFIACLIVRKSCSNPSPSPAISRRQSSSRQLRQNFARIAAEEKTRRSRHVDSQGERARDALRFDDKVYRLHLDVMTTLHKC